MNFEKQCLIVPLCDIAHQNVQTRFDYEQCHYLDFNFVSMLNKNKPLRDWFDAFEMSFRLWALKLPRPYSALKFAQSHSFCMQLLVDAPMFFSLLTDHAHKHRLSLNEFDNLVSMKRVDALNAVFCGSIKNPKQVLKFLHKLSDKKMSLHDLSVLKEVINNDVYLLFSHSKVVTMPFVHLLNDYSFLKRNHWVFNLNDTVLMNQVSYQLFHFLKTINDFKWPAFMMKKMLHISNWHDLTVCIKQIKDLYLIMSQYKKSVARVHGIYHANIQLIDNAFDLYELGEQQNNCVFDYIDEIVPGDYRIYKVEDDALSTLGVYVTNGYLEVDQLLTTNNKEVSLETELLVSKWIQTYNDGIAFSRGHRMSYFTYQEAFK